MEKIPTKNSKVDLQLSKIRLCGYFTIKSKFYASVNSLLYKVNLEHYMLYLYTYYTLKVDPNPLVYVYNAESLVYISICM